MEKPRNHGHRPNFKRNRFKFLHLELTELSVPKLPHLPNPYFRREIGNSDDVSPQISSRQQSLPNFKSDQHQVSLLQGSILLVPKIGQCPKPTMPRPYPEFYWALLYLWGIQPSPENLGQIDLANLMWESVEIWDPKFQRAQKRELEPKKIQWWVEGNISRLNFHRKIFSPGLSPNIFDRIQTQAYFNKAVCLITQFDGIQAAVRKSNPPTPPWKPKLTNHISSAGVI